MSSIVIVVFDFSAINKCFLNVAQFDNLHTKSQTEIERPNSAYKIVLIHDKRWMSCYPFTKIYIFLHINETRRRSSSSSSSSLARQQLTSKPPRLRQNHIQANNKTCSAFGWTPQIVHCTQTHTHTKTIRTHLFFNHIIFYCLFMNRINDIIEIEISIYI